MRALDVHGFAGAFALGTVRAGFELVGKREGPGGFGVRVMEANRHLLPGPWEAQAAAPAEWEATDAEYVFGNPPCSGFSGLNRSVKDNVRGPESPINRCMTDLVDLAARCRGVEAVAFESVPAAGRLGLPLMRALRERLEGAAGGTWNLAHVFMSCAAVGGAQYRPRYFWVATRAPFGVELPGRPPVTYGESIGDLVGLQNTLDPQPYAAEPTSEWARRRRNPAGTVDAHSWGKRTNGGDAPQTADRILEVWDQWPVGTKFPLHEEWTRRYGAAPRSWGVTRARKVAPDQLGYVITGGGGAFFLHWQERRWLTLRECARLMGFPDAWSWAAVKGMGDGYQQVGKQIPVDSGYWLSRWVRASLEGRPGEIRGAETGERERTIDVTRAHLARMTADRPVGAPRPARTRPTAGLEPGAVERARTRPGTGGRKGQAALAYLAEHPAASPGEIAAAVGCSEGRAHEVLRAVRA